MARRTSCCYCGTHIDQAKTGRPRQFCSDRCRLSRADIMRSLEPRQRPPFGAPLFHSADADRRLRALHAELRSTSRSCYQIANELQLSGDLLNEGRFAAVGADIERSIDRNFEDLEATASQVAEQ